MGERLGVDLSLRPRIGREGGGVVEKREAGIRNRLWASGGVVVVEYRGRLGKW